MSEAKKKAETLNKLFHDSHQAALAVSLLLGAVSSDKSKISFWTKVLEELNKM